MTPHEEVSQQFFLRNPYALIIVATDDRKTRALRYTSRAATGMPRT